MQWYVHSHSLHWGVFWHPHCVFKGFNFLTRPFFNFLCWFNQNQICSQLSQSLKPSPAKCFPSNLLYQYEVVIIGCILSCGPDDNEVKSELTNKFVKIWSNQWADAEYWIFWDASCPDWVELIVRAEKSDFHVDWIFKQRLLVLSQFFQGKNMWLWLSPFAWQHCLTWLIMMCGLVLRNPHKCTWCEALPQLKWDGPCFTILLTTFALQHRLLWEPPWSSCF